jgi:hypothetical protein
MKHLHHTKGSPWTMAEVRDLAEDRKRRSLTLIAEEMGVHRGGLWDVLRRAGMADSRAGPTLEEQKAKRKRELLLTKAYLLHYQDKLTWVEVADRIEWQYTVRSLMAAVKKFKKVTELNAPRTYGLGARRSMSAHRRSQQDVRDALVQGTEDAGLVERVLRNLRSAGRPTTRRALVTEAFAVGSTQADFLCRRFGLDPDAIIGAHLAFGDECPTCAQTVEWGEDA